MSISNYEQGIKLLCLHEAGHYVTAYILGFGTKCCSVNILDDRGTAEGGAEITLAHRMTNSTDIVGYLRDRIAVLYAGCAAQSLDCGRTIQSEFEQCWNGEGGKGDSSKAAELIQLLRNIECDYTEDEVQLESESLKISDEITRACSAIVEENSGAIEEIADALYLKIGNRPGRVVLDKAEIENFPIFQTISTLC